MKKKEKKNGWKVKISLKQWEKSNKKSEKNEWFARSYDKQQGENFFKKEPENNKKSK